MRFLSDTAHVVRLGLLVCATAPLLARSETVSRCHAVARTAQACQAECAPVSGAEVSTCRATCAAAPAGSCDPTCTLDLAPQEADAAACLQRCQAQSRADVERCERLNAAATRVADLPEPLFKDGKTGWYPVPVRPPDVGEHPSACERDLGEQATARPSGKAGAEKFLCSVAPDPELLPALTNRAADLISEDEQRPPSRKRGLATIWALVLKTAPKELCPPGSTPRFAEGEVTCTRSYERAAFCPKGSPDLSEAAAGCATMTCGEGEQDLSAHAKRPMRGCFTCAGGTLDLTETLRWRAQPEAPSDAADSVLCRVALKPPAGPVRLDYPTTLAGHVQEGPGRVRRALTRAGVADDRIIDVGLLTRDWPLTVDLTLAASSPQAAHEEALKAARLTAEAVPEASVVRLTMHGPAGGELLTATAFATALRGPPPGSGTVRQRARAVFHRLSARPASAR